MGVAADITLIRSLRDGTAQPTLAHMWQVMRMISTCDLIHVDEIDDVLADYQRRGIDAPDPAPATQP